MGETIEAFIEKLQTEGVEAGQASAEKIQSDAEDQAQQLISEAKLEAERIMAAAKVECEEIRTRSAMELKLAARDSVGRLREALEQGLRGVLSFGVGEQLSDVGFLQELLRDLVSQYIKADIEGSGSIEINVSKEVQRKLANWAIETIRSDQDTHGPPVDLRGSLATAGFEYSISEGTTEVTVDSVVSVLSDLVNVELRAILSDAVSEDGS